MRTYRLIFSSISILNQIPDAQTIFGALCGIIKKRDGEERLNNYLESLKTDDPWFIHSSMYPIDLFPFPAKNIFSLEFVYRQVQSKSSEEKLEVISKFKKYKRLKYISLKILNEYVVSGRLKHLEKDLLSEPQKFLILEEEGILCLSDESVHFEKMIQLTTRNGAREESLDKDLFYESQIFVSKNQRFQILIKTNLDIDRIKRYFEMFEYTGIGANRSIGMNGFHLKKVEEICFEKKDKSVYLLSKCIPQDGEFDYSRSYYHVDSRLFRGSKTYASGDYIGRFTRLLEGSLCMPAEEKEYYGQLVSVEVNGKVVDHYGIGMVV